MAFLTYKELYLTSSPFNYCTENVLLYFCICILFALYMSLAHRHPYIVKRSRGNNRSKSVCELKLYVYQFVK